MPSDQMKNGMKRRKGATEGNIKKENNFYVGSSLYFLSIMSQI